MAEKYFVLSTTALGKRQYFAGLMPSPTMPEGLTCLSDGIFSAMDFTTSEAAQECIKDLGLTAFEIVPCEFGMSAALKKGVKKSMDKALGREV